MGWAERLRRILSPYTEQYKWALPAGPGPPNDQPLDLLEREAIRGHPYKLTHVAVPGSVGFGMGSLCQAAAKQVRAVRSGDGQIKLAAGRTMYGVCWETGGQKGGGGARAALTQGLACVCACGSVLYLVECVVCVCARGDVCMCACVYVCARYLRRYFG